MLNLTTYLSKLKEFEGVYSYMYLDTADNVTVGVGQLLPNAEAAQKLAFVLRATANPPVVVRPATPDEIRADFDKSVSSRAEEPLPSTNNLLSSTCPIAPSTPCSRPRSRRSRNALHRLPDFNSSPPEACAAILDMGYNLGVEKLKTEFPSFSRAVRARDWATAARECERRGPGPDRNNWTKAQLENAAANTSAAQA